MEKQPSPPRNTFNLSRPTIPEETYEEIVSNKPRTGNQYVTKKSDGTSTASLNVSIEKPVTGDAIVFQFTLPPTKATPSKPENPQNDSREAYVPMSKDERKAWLKTLNKKQLAFVKNKAAKTIQKNFRKSLATPISPMRAAILGGEAGSKNDCGYTELQKFVEPGNVKNSNTVVTGYARYPAESPGSAGEVIHQPRQIETKPGVTLRSGGSKTRTHVDRRTFMDKVRTIFHMRTHKQLNVGLTLKEYDVNAVANQERVEKLFVLLGNPEHLIPARLVKSGKNGAPGFMITPGMERELDRDVLSLGKKIRLKQCEPAALVLKRANDNKIVIPDIKPGNFMLNARGEVCIIDNDEMRELGHFNECTKLSWTDGYKSDQFTIADYYGELVTEMDTHGLVETSHCALIAFMEITTGKQFVQLLGGRKLPTLTDAEKQKWIKDYAIKGQESNLALLLEDTHAFHDACGDKALATMLDFDK